MPWKEAEASFLSEDENVEKSNEHFNKMSRYNT